MMFTIYILLVSLCLTILAFVNFSNWLMPAIVIIPIGLTIIWEIIHTKKIDLFSPYIFWPCSYLFWMGG